MTKEQKRSNAEEFVAHMATQVFKQKLDSDVIKAAAEKLVRAVELDRTSLNKKAA